MLQRKARLFVEKAATISAKVCPPPAMLIGKYHSMQAADSADDL